jgi:SAM-dependent methyltransferase
MSFESLNQAVQRLNTSMQALAALGAEMRLRRESSPADVRVRERVLEVIRAIDPALFDGVTVDQEAIALGTIRSAVRDAMDLLNDPTRAPGWGYADPEMLQSQGQQSRRVVHAIDAFAARRPDLKQTLQRPGAFLDVGSGAGWLAIEAAQSWPALRTVGIDPWEPALNLARANIAAAGLDGRIELRLQKIEELPDKDEFTLVWLPGPFLPPEIVSTALERTSRALRPDGWVVFGMFGSTPDPLGEALTALRTVRSGGHPWTTAEVEQRLRGYGFTQIESSSPGLPTLLVVGKKPDLSRASTT